MIRKLSKIMRRLTAALLLIVIALNVYLLLQKAVLKKELPELFGYYQAVVISGSMEPIISVGDAIIVNKSEDYEKDDIIMFRRQGSTITHRITEKTDSGFITKGDANNVEDAYAVKTEDIYGKVVLTIPYVGRIILFFKSALGIMTLVIAGFLLISIPNAGKDDKNGGGTD